MKTTTAFTEKEHNEVLAFLRELPPESILAGQCASIVSLFIEGGYITASVDEILNLLCDRHQNQLDKAGAKQSMEAAFEFGTCLNIFTREPNNKFTPTDEGWFIGQDWQKKIKTNDFNVGL